MSHRPRWRDWLASPRWPAGIVLAALLLTAASLENGLILDDLFHRMVVQQQRGYLGEPRHALDLFAFFPGDAAFVTEARRVGLWPWWGSETRIHFFRPLAALTHFVDYGLLRGPAWLSHLHSLLWYGALVLAAGALFRRTLSSRWTAGLALSIYAVDGGHGLPVGWLATRNMILATLFGVLAITAHHLWRAEAWRPGRILAPAAFALALLSAEFGVGALGYLLAHAVVLERGRWRARVASVAPYLGVLVAWQLAYRALGFGAQGTGLYTDPSRQPLDFVAAVAARAPTLLASQLTVPFAELTLFVSTPARWAIATLGVALLLGFAALFRRQLARDPVQRFYALGAVLAVVPACTSYAVSRMALFIGFGAAALVAGFAEQAFDVAKRSRPLRALAAVLLLRHTLVAAALLATAAAHPRRVDVLMRTAMRSLPSDAALREQTLIAVNTPHLFLSNFVAAIRQASGDYGGGHVPARVRTLGESIQSVIVIRIDDRTLDVAVADGYLGAPLYQIVWKPGDARPPGTTSTLDDVRYEVLDATPDGRPRRVRARFSAPLEAPVHRWVAWQGDRFVPFAPPPVGSRVTLPPIDLLDVFLKLP